MAESCAKKTHHAGTKPQLPGHTPHVPSRAHYLPRILEKKKKKKTYPNLYSECHSEVQLSVQVDDAPMHADLQAARRLRASVLTSAQQGRKGQEKWNFYSWRIIQGSIASTLGNQR